MTDTAAVFRATAEQMAAEQEPFWHLLAELFQVFADAEDNLTDLIASEGGCHCGPRPGDYAWYAQRVAEEYLSHRKPGYPRPAGDSTLLGPCPACGRHRVISPRCECSHLLSEHRDRGRQPCDRGGCGCTELWLKPPKQAA